MCECECARTDQAFRYQVPRARGIPVPERPARCCELQGGPVCSISPAPCHGTNRVIGCFLCLAFLPPSENSTRFSLWGSPPLPNSGQFSPPPQHREPHRRPILTQSGQAAHSLLLVSVIGQNWSRDERPANKLQLCNFAGVRGKKQLSFHGLGNERDVGLELLVTAPPARGVCVPQDGNPQGWKQRTQTWAPFQPWIQLCLEHQ